MYYFCVFFLSVKLADVAIDGRCSSSSPTDFECVRFEGSCITAQRKKSQEVVTILLLAHSRMERSWCPRGLRRPGINDVCVASTLALLWRKCYNGDVAVVSILRVDLLCLRAMFAVELSLDICDLKLWVWLHINKTEKPL